MCGRFAQMIELEELMRSINLHVGMPTVDSQVPALLKSNQIFPTHHCVVAMRRNGNIVIGEAAFGHKLHSLDTSKSPKMVINARVETVVYKPLFKYALQQTRCVVPVSGYYEWKDPGTGKKSPYFIHPRSRNIGFLAGLLVYATSNTYPSLVIITKESTSTHMRGLHPREPLHLSLTHLDSWLSDSPISKDHLYAVSNTSEIELEVTPATRACFDGHSESLTSPSDHHADDNTTEQLRLF